MATFVVCWNSDVDKLGGGVRIAESNDGDVDVARFLDRLGVGPGVGHNDQTRLFERTSYVIGEVTGCETTSYRDSASVSSELEYRTLTVRTSRNDTDVGRIIDCSDDAGS